MPSSLQLRCPAKRAENPSPALTVTFNIAGISAVVRRRLGIARIQVGKIRASAASGCMRW